MALSIHTRTYLPAVKIAAVTGQLNVRLAVAMIYALINSVWVFGLYVTKTTVLILVLDFHKSV